eukprot:1161005-Pelagomonas_calceolata.AAC.6
MAMHALSWACMPESTQGVGMRSWSWYYENVGGEQLEAALEKCRENARIVSVCVESHQARVVLFSHAFWCQGLSAVAASNSALGVAQCLVPSLGVVAVAGDCLLQPLVGLNEQVCCGMISQYNKKGDDRYGVKNLANVVFKKIKMEVSASMSCRMRIKED